MAPLAALALSAGVAAARPAPAPMQPERVVVVASRAWLRELPDEAVPTHNWAARGAALAVAARSADGAWARVRIPGGAGHVALSWIKLSDCRPAAG